MRSLRASLVGCLALLMTVAAADAQVGSVAPGSQIGNHAAKVEENGPKGDAGKVKANDKAYSAALKNLPDKQYDPWHGVR
jgi:hypothetical protein